jgi:hypothetical protein
VPWIIFNTVFNNAKSSTLDVPAYLPLEFVLVKEVPRLLQDHPLESLADFSGAVDIDQAIYLLDTKVENSTCLSKWRSMGFG